MTRHLETLRGLQNWNDISSNLFFSEFHSTGADPKLSVDMEFTWHGLISPAISRCRKIGPAKRHERNVELLRQKSEYLYDMRDFVEEEKFKELMAGTIRTKEYQKWLYKEGEIESRVNNMLHLYKENPDAVMFSCMKAPDGDLMNILNEVSYHLENFPSGHGSMSDALHRTTKTLTSPRIEASHLDWSKRLRMRTREEKLKDPETKGESNVEVPTQGRKAAELKEITRGDLTPSTDESSPTHGHEKNLGFAEPETVVFTEVLDASMVKSPKSATKTLTSPEIGSDTCGQVEKIKNVNPKRHSGRKGKSSVRTTRLQCSPASFRSMVETFTGSRPIDIVPSAVTKPVLAVDEVSASNVEPVTEDEMICPPQIFTRVMHESEIQHACEIEEESLVHTVGTVENISDGNERMLPIHAKEFETVPSQNKGSQKELKFDAIVNQSIEPAARGVISESVASNIATVEPATASTFRKEDEMLPVDKAEAEISSKTERDKGLHESGFAVKRSTERTVLNIFQFVSGIETGKIGIHGIGGIGKTTLLKALFRYSETKRIFDMIILVTVSRYWSIRKIQNDVLRQLSVYSEDSEADSQVAEKLFQVLSGKKFLLLLDDVWEHINLGTVGIPDPSSENGCRIVMASRTKGVCHEMNVSKLIEMETLSVDEAWELFYEQVGGVINLPDIQPFARIIVEGCGGLPLLIIVTGRALIEEKNILAWEHASKKFSVSIAAAIFRVEDIIQLLKFSFDQLKDYDIRSCFLYCSLFPEDQEVNIFEFVEHCIEEGLIAGGWADARKRGCDIIEILVRASLLQVTEAGDCIKMHDTIRDLALRILSSGAEVSQNLRFLGRTYSRLTEHSDPGSSSSPSSLRIPESRLFAPEGYQFLLRAGAGLTEPPPEKEWEQAKMIFLMDNELCTLPERPNCSKLVALFLQRNYQLRVIPASFFQFLTSLKVLNLSKTRIKSFPKTLFRLENLEVLILRDCERLSMLPSEVGCLQKLEVLDLRGTEIIKLPDEIGKLTSLSHLEVYFYGSINYSEYMKLPHELISSGIISGLHSLKTLSIVVYPGDQRWYKDVKFVITEVSSLTELSSLCFHFPEVKLLELFLQRSIAWNAGRLTDFKFVVGHDVKGIVSRVPESVESDYNRQGKCLRFINGENIPEAVLQILACSTAFYLDHHLDICSLSNLGLRNINGLKFCIVSECPKIEMIVDSKELATAVFPSLENLSIHHLWNLTRIWEGIVPKGSFAGLRILLVDACPKLKFVFSSSMIQSMSNLEDLTVKDCPACIEIMCEGKIIDSGYIALPRLKKLTLHYLPELVSIWRNACVCPMLEHASFYNCPKLRKIDFGSKLKHTITEVKAEKSWWDALEWEDTELFLHLQNCFTTITEDDL